jgi:cytochrome P450 PksS
VHLERELESSVVRANPSPFYARLRKTAPVIPYRHTLFGPGFFLTRYEGVLQALTDPRFVHDRRNAVAGSKEPLDRWWMPRLFKTKHLLGQDEPEHRGLRNLVHKAFTPSMVAGLAARVERLVDEMLDAAAKEPTVDFMAALAVPLPMNVISELLGVPSEERATFRRSMSGFLESLGCNSVPGLIASLPGAVRADRFFRDLLKLRREQPGDDLISSLLRAEDAADRLSEPELVAMVFLLLFAGHETTQNLIGNGTLALLQHPDQLQKLREHPELIDSAVEELLRFSHPIEQAVPRFAREDVELQGYEIPRGSVVTALIASANHDEAVFDNPERLDITRSPNRHLTFGKGIHFCLGAPLARLEARITLLTLVQRFPAMRLAVPAEKLAWRRSPILHGLEALPLHLSPPASRPKRETCAWARPPGAHVPSRRELPGHL